MQLLPYKIHIISYGHRRRSDRKEKPRGTTEPQMQRGEDRFLVCPDRVMLYTCIDIIIIYIYRKRIRRQRRRNDGKQHTSFPFECK